MNGIARRLAALERATGAGRVEIHVFGTVAEANADAEPSRPGVKVLRIVTGGRVPSERNCEAVGPAPTPRSRQRPITDV